MIVLLTSLLGGIGLFLMGMMLLTDGLKSMAGESLRRVLVQFTGTPYKAFASGTLATVLVQSSSATTVTVIGLVSAGLLTFPQAVGVVIGASLGTTGTSWIVSLLGLKVSIGLYALPLVGIGAFLRLLLRGRGMAIGSALAGFGMIFVGIDTLQRGMAGLAETFDLHALPSSGFLAHLLMLLVGAAMTVIMQSSSAAVATTLTALFSNLLTFEQACSIVIGTSIGTTVTSALAAIGGSIPARRTALAHILFNLATGLIALVLLPLFLWGIRTLEDSLDLGTGPVSLAVFQTSFIALGVVLFLPFARQFAQVIERWMPDREPTMTRYLDDSVLGVPPVALEASRRTLTEIACELIGTARHTLDGLEPQASLVVQLQQSLDKTQHFLAKIPPLAAEEPMAKSRVAQMHAVDHLVRLLSHIHPPRVLADAQARRRLEPMLQRTREILDLACVGLRQHTPPDWLHRVEQSSIKTAELRRRERLAILEQTATDVWEPSHALAVLDAMRWLDRIAYHTWRISNYLSDGSNDASETVEDEALEEEIHPQPSAPGPQANE